MIDDDDSESKAVMAKRDRLLVRKHIANEIDYDIDHGEQLMKECFERLDGDEEFEVCYNEMRRIVKLLEKDKS